MYIIIALSTIAIATTPITVRTYENRSLYELMSEQEGEMFAKLSNISQTSRTKKNIRQSHAMFKLMKE